MIRMTDKGGEVILFNMKDFESEEKLADKFSSGKVPLTASLNMGKYGKILVSDIDKLEYEKIEFCEAEICEEERNDTREKEPANNYEKELKNKSTKFSNAIKSKLGFIPKQTQALTKIMKTYMNDPQGESEFKFNMYINLFCNNARG